MRVCKMFKATLPELLIVCSLRTPASLLCLPAIQAQFSRLVLLEICLPIADTADLPSGVDLSSLTWPHLRELRLINCAATRLVLDEVHYPQLRKLHVRLAVQLRTAQQLRLQLPLLLALELENACLDHTSALAACLSHTACPRLRRFSAVRVLFRDGRSVCPTMSGLDMPWMEHFELQDARVTSLALRAPPADGAAPGVLQPGGRDTAAGWGAPPLLDAAADAADAAVDMPAVSFEQGNDRFTVAMSDRHRWPTLPDRTCVPCSNKRVYVRCYGAGDWMHGEAFWAFTQDPRVSEVEVEESEGQYEDAKQ
ncbi:MAG: hypothetical protein WDW36_004610 [Sanguina aurantia]